MPTPDDIALAVGIDGYTAAPLASCVADADGVSDLLGRAGDAGATRAYSVKKLLVASGDPQTSREEVLDELISCLDRAAGHDFVFFFSGHAANNEWGTELIVRDDPVLKTVGMQELLTCIQRSDVRQAVVILDCCYSGSFARDPVFGPRPARFETTPSLVPENFALLAASQGGQPAFSGAKYSAFTELIIDGLGGGAADHNGHVTAGGLFGYAAPAFTPLGQRPVFKANLNANHPLRMVDPLVNLDLLRVLSVHFPPGTDEMALAAGDVVRPGDSAAGPEQERYLHLLELREHGLLVCPDTRHLSELAIEGATIRLSPRGWHLRLLAERSLI